MKSTRVLRLISESKFNGERSVGGWATEFLVKGSSSLDWLQIVIFTQKSNFENTDSHSVGQPPIGDDGVKKKKA